MIVSTFIKYISKNIHLLVSVLIVVPVAFIYGQPQGLNNHVDVNVITVDHANMLRSLMFLYLGISAVWILGVLCKDYWKIATQLNALFMISLAIGRLISTLMDGIPSTGFIYGLVAELILGVFSIIQLYRYRSKLT